MSAQTRTEEFEDCSLRDLLSTRVMSAPEVVKAKLDKGSIKSRTRGMNGTGLVKLSSRTSVLVSVNVDWEGRSLSPRLWFRLRAVGTQFGRGITPDGRSALSGE